jgi:hypothetical protein
MDEGALHSAAEGGPDLLAILPSSDCISPLSVSGGSDSSVSAPGSNRESCHSKYSEAAVPGALCECCSSTVNEGGLLALRSALSPLVNNPQFADVIFVVQGEFDEAMVWSC